MIRLHQRGGASIFVVIFVTIIISIITVSFTSLMIKNQQQSTASDLSKRAYDSAMAGVEDAKRVLVAAAKACAPGGSASECIKYTAAIDGNKCSTTNDAGIVGKPDKNGSYLETMVGSEDDNQAYTCVKIDTDTPNYKDSLIANEPTVVPLFGTESFTSVKISWFVQEDAMTSGQGATDTSVHHTYGDLASKPLPQKDTWGSTPSILRVQYIPGSVEVSTLDKAAGTVFLYPNPVSVDTTTTIKVDNMDSRDAANANTEPTTVNCDTSYGVIDGVCSATLQLPSATNIAYLQLTPLYNTTHVTVELSDGGQVDFNGVQPLVDSTGRASNLFRRVVARVKLSAASLPYPNAAINIQGNLCKTFSLSDKRGNKYSAGPAPVCNP